MRNLVILFLAIHGFSQAQVVSSFTNLPIEVSNPGSYSFFVGGHFHGSSNNVSGFPAASLLANIDKINADSSTFLVSTGDMFMDVKNNIPNYEKSFFSKLKIPLFNAVGNHDISGNVYTAHYGKTWSHFIIGTELYIILDAEINDGSIKSEQLNFFKEVLEVNCSDNSSVKNVFIFSHRPIWAENNDKLKNVFIENTKSTSKNNFESEILPLLKKNAVNHKIYWLSGSLGANAPASFFNYVDENKITFIQTAIRDLPRDGIIKVKINNSLVSFETVSLSSQKMPELSACGLNLWKNSPKQEPFNYRLIPLYLKQIIYHRYFWYGILAGIVIWWILRKIILKFKTR